MDPELEAYVKRAADPQLIPGIYNYCHQWCRRCSFTARCLTFRELSEYEARHPESGVLEQAHDSFEKTFALLEAWCDREGVDVDALRKEANSEESLAEMKRADEGLDRDPLYREARAYTHAAFTLAKSLEKAAACHAWSAEVRAAIETIEWYAGMVSAKVRRALHGWAERLDECIEWDIVQNDWNGSAKVARLAIGESRQAWALILNEGRAAHDSPMRKMIELLDRIESDLASRFPRAMEFVRPGFDEPAVAAGALTTLACFEPRPR